MQFEKKEKKRRIAVCISLYLKQMYFSILCLKFPLTGGVFGLIPRSFSFLLMLRHEGLLSSVELCLLFEFNELQLYEHRFGKFLCL